MARTDMTRTCLVHLASGVGNIVFATPLLQALDNGGYTVWSVVRAVHTGGIVAAARRERGQLVVPAVPPFYWHRFAPSYRTLAGCTVVPRPPDRLFTVDEQAYYLAFAEAVGCTVQPRPVACLPIAPLENERRVGLGTVVIAPGCKTGTMAAKRWPHFALLADRFHDVAVVGTSDDLPQYDGTPMRFASHVRSFVDLLTLRETAELMAAAGVVVANDSGLAHVAAASGVQTVMLFGPTDHVCLGPLPPNATVVRAGLACEPCWRGAPLGVCRSRVDCLRTLDVGRVERTVRSLLGADCAGEGSDERSAVCAR